MVLDKNEQDARLDWTVILSFTGALAACVAVWAGLIRAVEYLIR